MATSSTISTAFLLSTILLLARSADAGTARRLLVQSGPVPSSPVPSSPAPSSPSPIVTPSNLAGLPYVYDTISVNMYRELAPLVEAVLNNRKLFDQVLNCSETVGIPGIASEFGHTIFDAIYGFKAYGFCALSNMEEQRNRSTYMADYAGSLHVKSFLLQDYECENMTEMPQECYLHEAVTEAIEDATVEAYGMQGKLVLCSSTDSDGAGTPVKITTLPMDYEASEEPKYNCSPRSDRAPSSPAPPSSPSSPSPSAPAPSSPTPAP